MGQPKRFALALLAAVFTATAPAAAEVSQEPRPGDLDLVLLLDKSLSMAPFFDSVKSYAAGEVVGPLLSIGDRLIIELVYGKTERLFSGRIDSEADIARAVRAVRDVVADGKFTDLGAALDAAKKDLDELGEPDRTKYVLLLSDERQEAPYGSPYVFADFKLRHPALEYVVRHDLGDFRAISIGFNVGEKIASNAPRVLESLAAPTARQTAGPGPAGAGETKEAVPSSWTGRGASAKAPASPAPGSSANPAAPADPAGQADPAEAAEREDQAASAATGEKSVDTEGARIRPATAAAVGAAAIALAAVAAVLLLLKKKKDDRRNDRQR